MNALPCSQKRCQIVLKRALDADQITRRKAVILPDGGRTRGIVQIEDSLMTVPDDVYMSRTMVIRVNSNPQSANPQNGWHGFILS
jgi:hypothetical protein